MKALTLTQPWATLIAIGAKRIETRSWGTGFRGRIAIHAAKGLGPVGGKRGYQEQCAALSFASVLKHYQVKTIPLGAIVATAELVNVRPVNLALRAEVLAQTLTPNEIEFGDYASGRYAWYLENVIALPEPIPCVGHLSLWDVPPEVVAALQHEVALDRTTLEPGVFAALT